ncbi:hypothetical protein [Saccharicrinis sp. FJH54]|uniref:hypothetical protein n=1 Tax=Saccharicrinis sp. FJH54 TaxID=3344665 RepID=UPI0035D41516
MKKITFLLLFTIFSIITVSACEIEFKTLGEAKEVYSPGDIIFVKLTIFLTHRNCPEGLEATRYDYPGFKVLGATEWKEVKPGMFERKFKLQVIKPVDGKSSFSAIRTCQKEGGSGTFSVDVK